MKKSTKGVFISFEGLDGSGKSTQMAFCREYFEKLGREVLITREPGGTELGEAVRGLLLDPAYTGMDPRAELFLYAAGRAQHVAKVILPALEAGKVVITDRFADSTVAFQGFGRQLGTELVDELNRLATYGVMPDLTMIFSLSPASARRRMEGRGELDRIEREKEDFHQRVFAGYEALAAREPRRVALLDAEQPIEAIRAQVEILLRERVFLDK